MIKTILYIILILIATAPILIIVGSLVYAFYIEPIIDIAKNKRNSKTKPKTIIKRFAVLLILILAIMYYPWLVSIENGNTICKNIYGITMKCR